MFLLRVMMYVVFYKLFWNELVLCDLYLTRFDVTKDDLLFDISSLLCLTNNVVVMTEYLNSNHFQYQ